MGISKILGNFIGKYQYKFEMIPSILTFDNQPTGFRCHSFNVALRLLSKHYKMCSWSHNSTIFHKSQISYPS